MNKKAFISGGFDCLHEGHIYLLKEAAKLGDLIVAINHDKYFKKKGCNRPIDSLEKRIEKLKKTNLIKEIYPIEDNPLEIILKIRPDFIIVGNDYNENQVVGSKECKEWGGKVVIIDRIKGISTTKIIKENYE